MHDPIWTLAQADIHIAKSCLQPTI